MGIDVGEATFHPIRSMMKLDLITSSVAISVFLLFYFASVSVLTLYWVVIFNRSTPDANGINVWFAAVLSIGRSSSWRCRIGPGSASRSCSSARLHHGDVGLSHRPDRPPPYRLLLQRPRHRPAGGFHRDRLRAVDGQLHGAGRVAQPGPHRVGAGRLGMDPADHRGAVLPGAALRDHDVDDAGGQPGGGHHAPGDPGRGAVCADHAPACNSTPAPTEVIAGPAGEERAGPQTLATIMSRATGRTTSVQAVTAAGGLTNPQVQGLLAYNPLAMDIEKGQPVSQSEIGDQGGRPLAEPGRSSRGGGEAGARAEGVARGVEAVVEGLPRGRWSSPSSSSPCGAVGVRGRPGVTSRSTIAASSDELAKLAREPAPVAGAAAVGPIPAGGHGRNPARRVVRRR